MLEFDVHLQRDVKSRQKKIVLFQGGKTSYREAVRVTFDRVRIESIIVERKLNLERQKEPGARIHSRTGWRIYMKLEIASASCSLIAEVASVTLMFVCLASATIRVAFRL